MEDEIRALVNHFGIHIDKCKGIRHHMLPTAPPDFFRHPIKLMEHPFLPCLFVWNDAEGDFAQGEATMTLVFESMKEVVLVKPNHAFGVVLTDQLWNVKEDRLVHVSLTRTTATSASSHIVFATRAFHADVAKIALTLEKTRVRYINAATDMIGPPEVAATDDDIEVSPIHRSLTDPVTLTHFVTIPRVIVYTCCGVMYPLDFVFETFALKRLKKLHYPCTCPECGAVAFTPTGHMRRLHRATLEKARDKGVYFIENRRLQFV